MMIIMMMMMMMIVMRRMMMMIMFLIWQEIPTLDNNLEEISWCWFLGLVTEEIFYSIFSKFFPLGGDTYSGE